MTLATDPGAPHTDAVFAGTVSGPDLARRIRRIEETVHLYAGLLETGSWYDYRPPLHGPGLYDPVMMIPPGDRTTPFFLHAYNLTALLEDNPAAPGVWLALRLRNQQGSVHPLSPYLAAPYVFYSLLAALVAEGGMVVGNVDAAFYPNDVPSLAYPPAAKRIASPLLR